jgi:hypothetical protein
VIIDEAVRDEGTSLHYVPPSTTIPTPTPAIVEMLARELHPVAAHVRRGTAWTTDAPYRETADQLRSWAGRGVLAVEMQAASLFAFAQARAADLLERGFARAVVVEASAGYTAAASSEALRRGRSPQVEFVSGDFLEVAGTVPTASVVALDRVVCCYPLYEELLTAAVGHAERVFAYSYPRERWYVRAGMKLENALRSRKSGFQTFVHPETKMRELITRARFDLVFQRRTLVWSADVFVRQA